MYLRSLSIEGCVVIGRSRAFELLVHVDIDLVEPADEDLDEETIALVLFPQFAIRRYI